MCFLFFSPVQSSRYSCGFLLLAAVLPLTWMAQTTEISNDSGVIMQVDPAEKEPALSLTVPEGSPNDRTFRILMPEHVTVRPNGQVDVQHPYIYGHKSDELAVTWKRIGNALQYETTLGELHLLARATLVDDGILFHYEFTNSGTINYDMVTAVTDPRFRVVFYDPRLERTYVHHKDGFGLLASDMPARLTMPLKEWFPIRYLASYTAPIPADLVKKDAAGITYHNSPVRVDTPMIATVSNDGTWVAASFSRDPGNVWSNPELTCQHLDPQVPLPGGGHAQYEVKILIFKGSLQDALTKVSEQVNGLK